MTLAKLLAVALLPIGLLLLMLIVSLRARRRMRLGLVTLCILYAWVMSMPATARYLSDRADSVFPPLAVAKAPAAQAIVVLGGGIAEVGHGEEIRPGTEAARAWYGTRLLQAGKAPLLVISGGGEPPEAQLVSQLLKAWSVPAEQTILETRSRDTRQNAQEVRRLLAPRGIGQILLVTSSPHMQRAAAVFRAVGFEVSAFPVPFLAPPSDEEFPFAAWLPTARGLDQTTTILLEFLGRFYYQLRGWA